jgi:hypothetical protein
VRTDMAQQAVDLWTIWSPTAQVVGGFATGVAAAFGGIALWIARNQIKSAGDVAREQDAYRVYTEYLKLCIEYPHLSSSEMAKKYLNISSFVDIDKALTTESEKYLWFISYMMTACEKIYDALPNRSDWKSAVKAQIAYHSDALKHMWPLMKIHYKRGFVNLVSEVLDA